MLYKLHYDWHQCLKLYCKFQDIKSHDVGAPSQNSPSQSRPGGYKCTVCKLSLAIVSGLHLPESAHRLNNFFDYLMYFFFSSHHKFCFAFWCFRVDLLSGSSGHRSCEQYCAVHSRPDSPVSLSSAERDLIKELCSLSANHTGLLKVCTCSTACPVFNEEPNLIIIRPIAYETKVQLHRTVSVALHS